MTASPRTTGRHRRPPQALLRGETVLAGALAVAFLAAVAGSVLAEPSVSLADAVTEPRAQSGNEPAWSPRPFAITDRAANRSRTPGSLLDTTSIDTASAVADSPGADPSLPAPAPAAYVLPAEGRYTSCFCERWGEMHGGIDLANANGTPELAAAAGTVIVAGPAGGFGQWVQIRHDDGTVTVYGHMDTIEVAIGQQVTAGQLIATMGAQGNSTGPAPAFRGLAGG